MYRRCALRVRGLSSEFVNGKFYDMLKSVVTPLYEGYARSSQLSATAELLNIKSENNYMTSRGRKTRQLDSASTSTSVGSEPSLRRPQRTGSRDEAARVLASIWRVFAHSLSRKLQRSFTKSFMFIEKGTRRRTSSSMSDLTNKFCKLKEQKEHKCRTTGLNEGLKKGHTYGFDAAKSARLCAQSQHDTVGGRPFLGGYEEYMAAISRQMPSLEPPPKRRMPDREVDEMSGHGSHDGEDEGTEDEEIPPSS
ncbi:hypothetical protein M9H77_34472 [Catharanthus roseus]|uniref:Uncharacterized protein n=1 Tax=Catharanthus roseus TaxID=4058 RepID=A0ACB9ZQI0_CATRO|nr:hypothetical protein M9H77_34472 [Catharanthus roseus]